MLFPQLGKEGPFVISLDVAEVGGEEGVGLLWGSSLNLLVGRALPISGSFKTL